MEKQWGRRGSPRRAPPPAAPGRPAPARPTAPGAGAGARRRPRPFQRPRALDRSPRQSGWQRGRYASRDIPGTGRPCLCKVARGAHICALSHAILRITAPQVTRGHPIREIGTAHSAKPLTILFTAITPIRRNQTPAATNLSEGRTPSTVIPTTGVAQIDACLHITARFLTSDGVDGRRRWRRWRRSPRRKRGQVAWPKRM